jgi:predicted Ser/Thr protein kinase
MDETTTETASLPPASRRIGRYEITAELGRGAMGIVYKGFDPTIGRTVAIKTVLLSDRNEELIARFRREAQAAGVLNHPNIVTIYDAGEDCGVCYIAMEYVEGDALDKIIRGGPLALDMITHIMEEVGSALDLAHDKQIIHRDIKPANIMITGGHAKIMDFGVAKLASSDATATGTVIGTPSYMSPEVLKGQTIDGRADIFSLGVVLYEMLTGKRPFVGDSIPSVIYKIVGDQPAPPTAVNPKLHSGLDVLLAKALAKDPQERYQDCATLTRDLKNFRLLKAPAPAAAPAHISGVTPVPPQTARTMASPVVSGTVSFPPKTVAVAPIRVKLDPPPPPPPPVEEPPALLFAGLPWFVPAAIITVLMAVGAVGGALWWKQRLDERQAVQEQAERAEAAKVEAAKARARAAKPKPAPSSTGAAKDAHAAPAGTPAGTPAQTPARTVEVLVKANVDGAIIHVDGKTDPSWLTPHQVPMELGDHRVEVSKQGYRTSRRLMTLTGKEGDLEFHLTPLPAEPPSAPPAEKQAVDAGKAAPAAAGNGRLRILTFPPNAEVEVDGENTIYKTPVNILLAAGRHKITLKHKRTQDYSKQVIVAANEIVELQVNLFNPEQPIPARGARQP